MGKRDICETKKENCCLLFSHSFCGIAGCIRNTGTWTDCADDPKTFTKDIQKYMGHCGK